MATYFAKEFVGVRDGTISPPNYADARIVDSKKRCTRATKDNVNALAVGDKVYIGRLPLGAIAKTFSINTDTALGGATISIGTLANPTKYVNAKTSASVDLPAVIGPSAVSAVADPLGAIEDLYATIGGAAIPAAVNLAINTEYTISA